MAEEETNTALDKDLQDLKNNLDLTGNKDISEEENDQTPSQENAQPIQSVESSIESNTSAEDALSKVINKMGGPPRSKKQKTLYIAQKQHEILEYIANNTEVSQGEIVRAALDLYFKKQGIDI